MRVERLAHGRGLELPRFASDGSAGADLRAACDEEIYLEPGGRVLVPTGLRLAIPSGWEIQVRPRSGLALRHGVTVLNSPGTIDSDYRGEVGVLLVNLGRDPFVLRRGDRIAQALLSPVPSWRFADAEVAVDTARGAGGFGSSGHE